MSSLERALATIVYLCLPFFIVFTLMNFFLAIIGEVFGEEKERAKGGMSISAQVGIMLRERKELR